MPKLRLELEELQVETFHATPAGAPWGGTVAAHAGVFVGKQSVDIPCSAAESCFPSDCGDSCDTCAKSCYGSCDASCGDTCPVSCRGSCGDTCDSCFQSCEYTCGDTCTCPSADRAYC